MVEECHQVYFNENKLFVIEWQYHYRQTYDELFKKLDEDYKYGIFDQNAVFELKAKTEECFKIDCNYAVGIIFKIKEHHNPQWPDIQTIEPYVLPLNLSDKYGICKEMAEIFYAGLTISRANKLSVEDAILKPHSTKRHMFRPILVYKVDGSDRALVGKQKFAESVMILATNAIHWNAMFDEWLSLKCMQSFITKKGNEHDKILEDKIEEIVKRKGFLYCRNIKSFKQTDNKNNVNIDNEIAGEIDLIIVNQKNTTIYVADAKYNIARYEAVGYRMDYTNFINKNKPEKSYEAKLSRKVKWISENLKILEEHLSVVFKKSNVDLKNYKVEGVFIINTPTFYMFNGNFKAVTLNQFADFIDGRCIYPIINIVDTKNNIFMKARHPYFRKPIKQKDDNTEVGK